MKTIRLYKAQPISGNNFAHSVTLVFDEEIPTSPTLQEAQKLHQQQAEKLAEVLFKTLAGGTVDALLVEMLKRKASLFIIPHPDPIDPRGEK